MPKVGGSKKVIATLFNIEPRAGGPSAFAIRLLANETLRMDYGETKLRFERRCHKSPA